MNKRKGFTIIEVIMFVAISAALFIGVAVGMQNSIFQQKYNDTTQNFVEFLRSVYSEVMNPQSNGAGNSEIALYGKLIVFGESRDINGDRIDGSGGDKPIFTYDVVGDARINAGSGPAIEVLRNLHATVLIITKDGPKITNVESIDPAKYTPHYGAYIESPEKDADGKNELYTGSILIVRHPASGVVNTLKTKAIIQVNQKVDEANKIIEEGGAATITEDSLDLLAPYLNFEASEHFETGEIDFCINPYAETMPSDAVLKRNVRIINNSRNASGIELIDLDSDENRCK